jgi:hypothetical protein
VCVRADVAHAHGQRGGPCRRRRSTRSPRQRIGR